MDVVKGFDRMLPALGGAELRLSITAEIGQGHVFFSFLQFSEPESDLVNRISVYVFLHC